MDELYEDILEEEETPEEPGVWVYPLGGKYYAEVFDGGKEEALARGFVRVTPEQYQALTEHRMCWQDLQLVDAPADELAAYEEELRARDAYTERCGEIFTLKRMLSETDYKAIKYAEGMIAEEEYAPIREQRQSARDRINYLQSLNT